MLCIIRTLRNISYPKLNKDLQNNHHFRQMIDFLSKRKSELVYPVIYSQCDPPYFQKHFQAAIWLSAMLSLVWLRQIYVPLGLAGLGAYRLKRKRSVFALILDEQMKQIKVINKLGEEDQFLVDQVQILNCRRVIVAIQAFNLNQQLKAPFHNLLNQCVVGRKQTSGNKQEAWRLQLSCKNKVYEMLIREQLEQCLSRGKFLSDWIVGRLEQGKIAVNRNLENKKSINHVFRIID